VGLVYGLPSNTTRIASVLRAGRRKRAGLKAGDTIVSWTATPYADGEKLVKPIHGSANRLRLMVRGRRTARPGRSGDAAAGPERRARASA
jgi:S1-C subfamily serine protease